MQTPISKVPLWAALCMIAMATLTARFQIFFLVIGFSLAGTQMSFRYGQC